MKDAVRRWKKKMTDENKKVQGHSGRTVDKVFVPVQLTFLVPTDVHNTLSKDASEKERNFSFIDLDDSDDSVRILEDLVAFVMQSHEIEHITDLVNFVSQKHRSKYPDATILYTVLSGIVPPEEI